MNRVFHARIPPLQLGRARATCLVLALSLVASTSAASASARGGWPTSGWPVSTPDAQGMDSTLLAEARDFALTGAGSGIITRHGQSVMTWGSQSSRKDVKSATKSIGAVLLGLALLDGLVALPDSAAGHLAGFGTPPASNEATGWLPGITLLQLATHTAGFDKPAGYIDLESAPGTTWQYSDGGANWLADVLTVRFGEDLHDVLFGRALTPMGLTSSDVRWRDNMSHGDMIQGIKSREFGSGISADVDALARIGYLFLRDGDWDGTRILPAGFAAAAGAPAPSIAGATIDDPVKFPDATSHYGLLWWNNGDGTLADVPPDACWAWGLNENLIIVIPSLDIVAARGSDTGWRSGWDGDYTVIAPFLQPIARSTGFTAVESSTWGAAKARFRGSGETD